MAWSTPWVTIGPFDAPFSSTKGSLSGRASKMAVKVLAALPWVNQSVLFSSLQIAKQHMVCVLAHGKSCHGHDYLKAWHALQTFSCIDDCGAAVNHSGLPFLPLV